MHEVCTSHLEGACVTRPELSSHPSSVCLHMEERREESSGRVTQAASKLEVHTSCAIASA